ncbi:MAG: glycosyltransferase family 2 protein [Richelia sp. RM2_1_2]|nr:glycosyltransferase family 2 protein [Richelia sp. RM2_1_2]
MSLEKGITVIICCYNSSTRIEKTLRSLSKQDILSKHECEIIVVNNASTDDTEEVVNQVWEECGNPYPLKIYFEASPGLAFARKCGAKQARYSYGVFCDDDNWLAPDYLSKVFQIFENNKKIGVIGGVSTPAFDDDANIPPWFYTNCNAYAVGTQAQATGEITYRGYVWGAGMGFRTYLLKEIFGSGIEPIISDRKGELLTSGGDGEICIWYIFAGYRLWYDETLTFKHYIPKVRLNYSYYEKLLAGFKVDKKWPVYHNYIILKYGLFNDPRRKKFPLIFILVRKIFAILVLLRNINTISLIRKIEKNVPALFGQTHYKNEL